MCPARVGLVPRPGRRDQDASCSRNSPPVSRSIDIPYRRRQGPARSDRCRDPKRLVELRRWCCLDGRSPRDLRAIVLTDAHADHAGFAERARFQIGSKVWVHKSDLAVAKGAKQAKDEGKLGSYLRYLEAWKSLFGLVAHGGATIAPVLEASSFVDGQVLELPGSPQVVHMPGLTAGMAALFREDRGARFTGDALVTRNPQTGRMGP
jgi:glyoxylase-like metal-dependent hydrolase (beta-lactamase superfamily II)